MENSSSQQFDGPNDSQQAEYSHHETRPIQGHSWTRSVPLLKDERPWIRWPIYLFYKLPLSLLPSRTADRDPSSSPLLTRLTGEQIFMICIGSTVGIGFAVSSGEILAIAGPAGTLIAYTVVGVVVICVMEGICEMTSIWPIANAMPEFVRAFVDEDLAIVVGITHWYAYCCAIPALMIGAGSMLLYFNISAVFLDIAYVAFSLFSLLINCLPIEIFGIIGYWTGTIKLLVLLGIFILMICINVGVRAEHYIGTTAINDGLRNNPNVAANRAIAVLITIPLAVFSYMGVEATTVTALEAANPRALRWTTKNIAYITITIYLITIGGICANVEWFDRSLPRYYSQSLVPLVSSLTDLGHTPIANQSKTYSTSIAIAIATLEAGSLYNTTTSVFLGLLIFFALSCGTTSLYTASRVLYSLCMNLDLASVHFYERYFARLSAVTLTYRIPVWPIFASLALLNPWVLFVNLGLNQMDLFIVLSSIASKAVLLVWASQCLAFIRYHKCLSINKIFLRGSYKRLQRWPMSNEVSSHFAALQPIPAYIGLVSCLAIILIFSATPMWNGDKLLLKVLTMYFVPTFSLLLFLLVKFWRRNRSSGWVKTPWVWGDLADIIDRLDAKIHYSDTTEHNNNLALPSLSFNTNLEIPL